MTFHRTTVHREAEWPYQWLGSCSCGVGIRCNAEAEAEDFLIGTDCMDPEMRASLTGKHLERPE